MAGSGLDCNETSCFIKCGKFLDKQRNYKLVKNDSGPSSLKIPYRS
jgi:hypothetical protein